MRVTLIMVRFGKYCSTDERLTFWGKLSYKIHGTPHILKFMESRYFVKAVKKNLPCNVKNFLDIGCSAGDYSFYLAEKYHWLLITAIDADKNNIAKANTIKKKINNTTIEFINKKLDEFNPAEKYDAICFIQCLHAIRNKKQALQKAANLLTTNGLLFFQDILKDSYKTTILGKTLIPFEHYEKNFVNGELQTAEEIISTIQEAGLTIIKNTRTVGFRGQLAWEIDQHLQCSKTKYIRTLSIPFIKIMCLLEFLFPFGKKNELFIIARKQA